MSRSTPLLLLASLLASCAPQVFRADAGVMFLQSRGDVALQNSGGSLSLGGSRNELPDALDLGDAQPSPFVRLIADWDEHHRVKLGLTGFGEDTTGTLQSDFGNIPAGSAVSTSMDYFAGTLAWSYDLVPGETFRVAPGVQAGFYSMNVAARSGAFREKVTTDVIVPEVYLDGEANLGPVALFANLGVMSADLGDADGRYVDAEAGVALRPVRQFEFIAGWRHIVMDAIGRASSRDFDSDVYVTGWFIGGGVRF